MFYKLIIIVVLIVICPVLIVGAEIDDPAMEFYLNKADSVLSNSTLFENNLRYSVSLKLTYDKVSYRGEINESDTAELLMDFDNAKFVILQIIDTSNMEENGFPSDIRFEKPWELNCRFHFFPRDTGAGDLAIGFAPADTVWNNNPEGLLIIDRNSYHLKSLYLHYLDFKEYEWLSREYHFSYENNIALLKSLKIQGCYFGFFQRRFFRQDMNFNNYDFH